jgi:hypothetical protein
LSEKKFNYPPFWHSKTSNKQIANPKDFRKKQQDAMSINQKHSWPGKGLGNEHKYFHSFSAFLMLQTRERALGIN